MKVTKEIISKAFTRVLNGTIDESSDGPYAGKTKYRDSFKRMVKMLSKKGNQKNTPPYTDKPTVGKSGPAGSP